MSSNARHIPDNFKYVRDYIEYFIEWYAKRSKHYISDGELVNIVCKMRKKYGSDCARNGPLKPLKLNERFGLNADGDFCRVQLYDAIPMNGEKCYVCGAITSSEVTAVASETWLTEYNTEGRFVGDLCCGVPLITLTKDIKELDSMSVRCHPNIYYSLCRSAECTKLHEWRHGEAKSACLAKELQIKRNAPSYQMLEKQSNQYRKSFFASRYLDYHARLKFAEDKLTG